MPVGHAATHTRVIIDHFCLVAMSGIEQFDRDRHQFNLKVDCGVQAMSRSFWGVDGKDVKFVDQAGVPKAVSDILERFVASNGRARERIVSPAVTLAARAHFNCSTLPGAELEDDLGAGSAGSHWEERVFDGELMDSQAGSNGYSAQHALSPLTLGLLQDSGWCVRVQCSVQQRVLL